MARTLEIRRTPFQGVVDDDWCWIYSLPERAMLANERVLRVVHDGRAQTFRFAEGGLAVRLPDGVDPDTVTVELVGGTQ